MKLENLPKTKELQSTKRVGRGPGSGMGKTSTRGQKATIKQPLSNITYLEKIFCLFTLSII